MGNILNPYANWTEPTPCGNGLRSEVRRCSGVGSTRVVGDHDDDGGGDDDGSIDHCRYRSIGGDGCGRSSSGRAVPAMALVQGFVPRR